MLTAGDVQFEPQQPKVRPLTTSIVAMLAGDSAMQEEIFQNVYKEVRIQIEARPTEWLEVGFVATVYGRCYREARLRRTERAILSPLGLDNNTFISRQREMNSEFVRHLATELLNFEVPRTQTILTGVDLVGPHIYVVADAEVSCLDAVGFAAIGIGQWHANSQLMFAGHTRKKPAPETLLLTYATKKRAEVAPGVGEATDMFGIGPAVGTYAVLPEEILKNLERIYQKTRKKTSAAITRSNSEVNQYVRKIAEATPVGQQTTVPKDSGGDETVKEENPPGNAVPSEDALPGHI